MGPFSGYGPASGDFVLIVAAQCCVGLDADLVVLLVHHVITMPSLLAPKSTQRRIEEALCPRLLHGLLTYDSDWLASYYYPFYVSVLIRFQH